MIKLQLRLPIDYTDADARRAAASALGVQDAAVKEVKIAKRSVDARKKPVLTFVATAAVKCDGEDALLRQKKAESYTPLPTSLDELDLPEGKGDAVIVGFGPAGMFAALTLAKRGMRPIVLERGEDVDRRTETVTRMRLQGILDPSSNVQFGEGGAGTFSDGKLNTGTVSPYSSAVIGELIRFGAPAEIGYLAKPHIGTDYLASVVKALRQEVIRLGGEVRFGTRVRELKITDGRVTGVVTDGASDSVIDTDTVILAIGHSARDTYEMLSSRVPMTQKPFSVGVRIEHLQSEINKAQYGSALPPFAADYALSAHLDDGRGVYTFCMCPGGEVVMAGSEEGGVATNGMSNFARDGRNANSAVLVNVDGRDFGEGLLDGVAFQRRLECAAYNVGGGYRAPVQRADDFAANRVTRTYGGVLPTIRPEPVKADLNTILPPTVTDALKFGLKSFACKIRAFGAPDALLTGVETRSSAPVRILRGDNCESAIVGLYPAGEGAGYAGGIMSAAADGIRVAAAVLKKAGG